ncbi:MAG: hypothetical protein ACXWCZ_00285 [Flavisolibacter sp.]
MNKSELIDTGWKNSVFYQPDFMGDCILALPVVYLCVTADFKT